MSYLEKNPFSTPRPESGPEAVYPSEFHFRIIVDAQQADACSRSVREAASAYRVTSPLAVSRHSSAGRYLAFSLSVRLESREEMEALDAAIKRVPGVRLLL